MRILIMSLFFYFLNVYTPILRIYLLDKLGDGIYVPFCRNVDNIIVAPFYYIGSATIAFIFRI